MTVEPEQLQVPNALWPAFIQWRYNRRHQDNYTPHLEETFEDYFMRFVRPVDDLRELVDYTDTDEFFEDEPEAEPVDIWRFFRGGRTTFH